MDSLNISLIAENLYLGGRLTPERAAYLRNEGVTVMVSLQDEAFDPMDGLDAHLWLPTPDNFPPTTAQLLFGARFIESQLRLDKKVYVHCYAGVGRSAMLCMVCYLLQGYGAVEAYLTVEQARPCVSLNGLQRSALEACAVALQSALAGKV